MKNFQISALIFSLIFFNNIISLERSTYGRMYHDTYVTISEPNKVLDLLLKKNSNRFDSKLCTNLEKLVEVFSTESFTEKIPNLTVNELKEIIQLTNKNFNWQNLDYVRPNLSEKHLKIRKRLGFSDISDETLTVIDNHQLKKQISQMQAKIASLPSDKIEPEIPAQLNKLVRISELIDQVNPRVEIIYRSHKDLVLVLDKQKNLIDKYGFLIDELNQGTLNASNIVPKITEQKSLKPTNPNRIPYFRRVKEDLSGIDIDFDEMHSSSRTRELTINEQIRELLLDQNIIGSFSYCYEQFDKNKYPELTKEINDQLRNLITINSLIKSSKEYQELLEKRKNAIKEDFKRFKKNYLKDLTDQHKNIFIGFKEGYPDEYPSSDEEIESTASSSTSSTRDIKLKSHIAQAALNRLQHDVHEDEFHMKNILKEHEKFFNELETKINKL